MSRRRLVAAAAVAGVVAAPLVQSALAADAPLPADYPTAGCFTYTDPKGDAVFEAFPDDPDLDVLGFSLETTATSLKGYAKIDGLTADGPAIADGHRYTLKFTFNNHVFSASGSDYGTGSGDNGTGAIRDGLAATGQAAHVTQLGVDTPAVDDPNGLADKGFVDSGLKVTFDYTNSWVIWDLPIADIEKYGQAKFSGDLTTVSVAAQTDEYAVGSVWDTAPDNNDDGTAPGTWTVGDNKCFGGGATSAAATIVNTGATKVQYGDTAKLGAKVTGADGKPIAKAPVTFAIGRLQTTAKTNAKGIATAQLTPKLKAGKYTLVTSYAPKDATAVKLRSPFSVTLEKTALSLTAAKTTVVATLHDNDKHPVIGQKIVWTVNGKKAATTTTNAKGLSTFKGAKKGQTVKATFAGVKGKYAGATAKRKL